MLSLRKLVLLCNTYHLLSTFRSSGVYTGLAVFVFREVLRALPSGRLYPDLRDSTRLAPCVHSCIPTQSSPAQSAYACQPEPQDAHSSGCIRQVPLSSCIGLSLSGGPRLAIGSSARPTTSLRNPHCPIQLIDTTPSNPMHGAHTALALFGPTSPSTLFTCSRD